MHLLRIGGVIGIRALVRTVSGDQCIREAVRIVFDNIRTDHFGRNDNEKTDHPKPQFLYPRVN